ncbi:MAG: type II toxin-antitoxin system VapC family toxin [Candidatus Hydrogenedentes bacterium]|nr:type II toxin-antitoxin system VapC family toxin [Candidatus Hydrogenedentota bacterium]
MIFDTDVLIWAMRGNARAATAIDKADSLALSVVSYMELLRGVRNRQELQATKAVLAELNFEILPLTGNIGHRASIYLEEYALKSNIGVPDALIAATAVEDGGMLCTANAKDYRSIAELKLSVFRP